MQFIPGRRRGDARTRRSRASRAATSSDSRNGVDVTTALSEILPDIHALPVSTYPDIIDKARSVDNVPLQSEVIRACLQQIIGRTPRYEQVRTLRRLIFSCGDTLLIARTGWGKSIIFHAFSVLTRLITIQIIPLSKLGDEQLQDIARLGSSNPCLITHMTRKKEVGLFRAIKEGRYSHILLGPEQASSPAFRELLRTPEMQSRVGLVAIDECHTIRQWKQFRPSFSMLKELRYILRQDVIWFACSATLDHTTEVDVLLNAGFRAVGEGPYKTEVIRTSIDRADISICVCPIPRKQLLSFRSLDFLLRNAVSETDATPHRIAKTIVFVDGRQLVMKIVSYIRHALIALSAMLAESLSYTMDCQSGLSVTHIVRAFTSTTSDFDKDQYYSAFKEQSSRIRIMVATTSLGMGINVPDVERVVQWNLPISRDLGDVWQRLGRGGRGHNRRSIGYVFLPYWMFDCEGQERPDRASTKSIYPSRRLRNYLPAQRLEIRLCQSQTSMSETQLHRALVSDDARSETSEPSGSSKVRYWTRADREKRQSIKPEWRDLVNSTCHRRVLLSFLGEDKPLPGAENVGIGYEQCCSACNPRLRPVAFDVPINHTQITHPKSGTRAAVALREIDQWARSEAEKMFDCPERRFPVPPDAFMASSLRYSLAHLFDKKLSVQWFATTTHELTEWCCGLLSWTGWMNHQDTVLSRLQGISIVVETKYADLLALRFAQRNSIANHHVQQTQTRDDVATCRDYRDTARQKDDLLATIVAKRLMATAQQVLLRDDLPIPVDVELQSPQPESLKCSTNNSTENHTDVLAVWSSMPSDSAHIHDGTSAGLCVAADVENVLDISKSLAHTQDRISTEDKGVADRGSSDKVDASVFMSDKRKRPARQPLQRIDRNARRRRQ